MPDPNNEHDPAADQIYVWDEIDGTLGTCDQLTLQQFNDEGGWTVKVCYPNGVARFEDDRGHVALQVERMTYVEARQAFAVDPTYREMHGLDA